MLKVYAYKNCDTCRKALKWLEKNNIAHEVIPIREQPPTTEELKRMLKIYDGGIRKLFNTSGQDYKTLNLKDELPKMSEVAAIQLLTQNGNLVKRPFALGKKQTGGVGFNEEEWQKRFLKS